MGGGVLVLFFPVCDRPHDYFSKAEAVSAKPGNPRAVFPLEPFCSPVPGGPRGRSKGSGRGWIAG